MMARSLTILSAAAALLLAGCATAPPGALTQPPTTSPPPAISEAPAAAAPIVASATPAPKAATHPAPVLLPSGPLSDLPRGAAASQSVTSLTAPADLWERIRRGHAMPALENDLVRNHERWYATRPDYMQRMTERSSKYLFHIVEELERRNMPSELALLPYIESAFNPRAVSSAKAAGMWQFMPATGRFFELKQNAFRDDRRDVLASTRAALDYLQKLHGMFGDWHLALAAYNWGEGNVQRAIERNRKAGKGTGYEDLNMPAETRQYVPKLQAVKNIVTDPPRFSATLPLIENHPYFQSVAVQRDIDVALAAKMANVALDDFRELNPSLNRPVILASGNPQILLPWDNAAIFRANLRSRPDGQFATWTAWKVPSTMGAAEAARRVNMSETELREVNDIPQRMLIQAGSTLVVRRAASMTRDVAEHVADNAQLSLSRQPLLARRTVRAGKSDSVASLARRYKVSAADVAQWNGTQPTAKLRNGQSLVVYMAVRDAKAAAKTTGTKPRNVAAKTRAVAKSSRTLARAVRLAKK